MFGLDQIASNQFNCGFQLESPDEETFYEPEELFRSMEVSSFTHQSYVHRSEGASSPCDSYFYPQRPNLKSCVDVPFDFEGQQFIPRSPTALMRSINVPLSIKHEECISRIDAYLRSKKDLSFFFDGGNCSWKCQHSNEDQLCNFDINLYRANEVDERLVVEFQDIDGDRSILKVVSTDLMAELARDSSSYLTPISLQRENYHQSLEPPASSDLYLCPIYLRELSLQPESRMFEGPQDLFNAQLKRNVVDDITRGGYQSTLSAIQGVVRMYHSSPIDSKFAAVDLEIAELLMRLLSGYEACDDLICQSAMLALAEMSRFEVFCEQILSFDNASFLVQMQQFAVPEGPYYNESARRYCVRILANMLAHSTKSTVESFGGKTQAEGWLRSDFARSQIGEDAFRAVYDAILLLS